MRNNAYTRGIIHALKQTYVIVILAFYMIQRKLPSTTPEKKKKKKHEIFALSALRITVDESLSFAIFDVIPSFRECNNIDVNKNQDKMLILGQLISQKQSMSHLEQGEVVLIFIFRFSFFAFRFSILALSPKILF